MSQDEHTADTDNTSPPAALSGRLYHPDGTGRLWVVNVPQLDQPPEFVPNPAENETAIARLEGEPDTNLGAQRHAAAQRAKHMPSAESITDAPDSQDETEEQDTAEESLTGRLPLGIKQITSRLEEFPPPTEIPLKAYAMASAIATTALVAGIIQGGSATLGVLLVSTGCLLVYVALVTLQKQAHRQQTDQTASEQLYERGITALLGIVLLLIGVNFIVGFGAVTV